jgi:hypothetical protein
MTEPDLHRGRAGLGEGRARGAERIFDAPLTIEPTSTIVFSRGAVAHVFAAATVA